MPTAFLDMDFNYSITSVIHLFMSRLHQPYEQILRMPRDRRIAIFELELQVIQKENDAVNDGSS